MPNLSQGRFREGDLALLVDRRGRRYQITLRKNGLFETHVGTLPHTEIIGQEQGIWRRTSRGQNLLIVKPSMSDYIFEMPRGSQVIYPKDLGAILLHADIFPGATVVEAGLGSGGLTAALLRAVGEKGRVITYEIREDMVTKGLRNITALAGVHYNHSLKMADIYCSIDEVEIDRLVLDVPEPWQAVPSAAEAIAMGGIFLSFLPTVLQVHRLVQTLEDDSRFQMVETVELIQRPWHIAERSARPAHRMVAHTGFITTARRCIPRGVAAQTPTTAPDQQGPEEDSDG